ncbi:MAG: hypothetical protein OWP43_06740 [Sphaerochaetaceae bacterium]|nr:hypothetical protein [Sphaerochaetaceae bacterium]
MASLIYDFTFEENRNLKDGYFYTIFANTFETIVSRIFKVAVLFSKLIIAETKQLSFN